MPNLPNRMCCNNTSGRWYSRVSKNEEWKTESYFLAEKRREVYQSRQGVARGRGGRLALRPQEEQIAPNHQERRTPSESAESQERSWHAIGLLYAD